MANFVPHPYQMRGIELLATHRRAGLLLDPGMGKTMTTLYAFDLLRQAGMVETMLVVAPIKPMYDTWPRECLKWAETRHLRCAVIHGPKKRNAFAKDADIYLVNPEGIPWFLENRPKNWRMPDVLCVDESTKFKNGQAKRFKAIKKLLPEFAYRWILTGTVVPNGLIDMWAQAYLMDEGEALGQYVTHYKRKYFDQKGFGGYTLVPKEGAMEEITAAVAPMVLKLDAEDWLQMPELKHVTIPVDLPPSAREKYDEVEQQFFATINGKEVSAVNMAAAGMKCRQIANGACYVDEDEDNARQAKREWTAFHDQKLQALDGIVEETNGCPLLILYEYKHDVERIQQMLGDDAVNITGMTGKRLEKVVDMFNRGQIKYLLAHPGTLHGMNIQGACRHMVWYGITWNLEHFIQATWRLYRQGQKGKTVMCYALAARDTLDEAVIAKLAEKDATQTALEDYIQELAAR